MAPNARRWPSREGFTADALGDFISRSLLDPWKLLPIIALAHYTAQGRDIAKSRPNLYKALKVLTAHGLINWLNNWLDHRTINNSVSDAYNWHRETVILTGGSNGIGRRIAELLGARDIKVAILDIAPQQVRTNIADVASKIRASFGRPSILINNAGICTGKTIIKTTAAQTRRMFEVNTFAHYWLAQEFLPDMIEANHGMVVTVASQAGYTVTPNMVDYSASKAAAIAFHEGLGAELVTRYHAPKIRTVLVTQGFTRTNLIKDLTPEDTWFNPLLHPETVAEQLVEQVLKGESGHVVVPGSAGWIAKRFRGLPAWLQHSLRCKLEKLMRAD
ncbi:Short-chain dehydrogenase/reductase SDR [Penicillium concentricum]|uniref:Short-chain dehydrogenase/reductase SDR n=1 Tax=Penicillium concentricum TaxID=293559 RepID=A0A9W9RSZ5_9EURO|nr:Short-chain dehydrogenase/reductase SDR [Penicillium concentricum]KAJ5365085.1 Short-chain dehydrogenase/reductase SDR [Penicillium concentricum]